MCGIAGFWQGIGDAPRDMSATAAGMALKIAHRGPDDHGVWCDPARGFAIAHRRLSILDLSAAGHQPMESHGGRYILALNGEIYNHLELRDRLEKEHRRIDWRGHSDTETLLACVEAWGVERTLEASIGMFAIALWDRSEQTLVLARDRVGEKPLYLGFQGNAFLFGSELKALKAHPSFDATVDRGALALMLRYNCIPAPHSIYSGIQKLMPGCWLRVTPQSISSRQLPQPTPYWHVDRVFAEGLRNPVDISAPEATQRLEEMLVDSIRLQMLSDAPLGAFLSGGIDSSTIVALMQSQSTSPIRTFTIGSESRGYNEAEQALAVAKHLGTSHTELYVSADDALAVIPRLPTIYCEPFSDSSQVPTYLVSELASRHVKVALSGDAADELFCGYNRYLMAASVWNRVTKIPRSSRRVLAKLLTSISPEKWDGLMSAIGRLLPGRLRMRMPGDKAHKFAGVLLADDGASYYRHLVSHWQEPGEIVLNGEEPAAPDANPESWPDADRLIEWMMAMDTKTYLPDDILVKVDRAAMANSLETRAPFLDHRVVEFSWRLPLSMKIRDGESKWLLRQVLDKYVPRHLVDRPKMGFGVPLHDWLRGPLRDWTEDLLDEQRLRREGYFDPLPIREAWDAHLSGRSNQHYHLWDVLMFQAWLAEQ